MSPEEIRLKLRRNDYCPLPLNGKNPGFNNWQKQTDVPDQQIRLWTRQWPEKENTGVLTARTPTIDLDILDPDAAEAAEQLVRELYEEKGRILVRFGARPKRAIPFRTDAPFDKIVVNFDAAPGAPAEKIEMLGDGQQVVVDGVHPDTRQPYSWHGGSLSDVRREELPYIHAEEAQELVNAVVALLVERFGYRVAGKKKPNGATCSHIWRSKDHDYPCSPTGREHRDDADGRIYAQVRSPDGTESFVPKDDLVPAHCADWSFTPDDLIDHDRLAALAMRLVKSRMNPGAVHNFLRQNVERLEGVDPARRQRRLDEIPGIVATAKDKIDEERRTTPEAGGKSPLESALDDFAARVRHAWEHDLLAEEEADVLFEAVAALRPSKPLPYVDLALPLTDPGSCTSASPCSTSRS